MLIVQQQYFKITVNANSLVVVIIEIIKIKFVAQIYVRILLQANDDLASITRKIGVPQPGMGKINKIISLD